MLPSPLFSFLFCLTSLPMNTIQYTEDEIIAQHERLEPVKSLGSDRIGEYGVLFGGKDATDLDGHYFDATTDYWLDKWTSRPMIYGHGGEGMKATPVIGTWDTVRQDEKGIWFEGQLDKAHKYYAHVKGLVEKGALKLSSDSIQHLLMGTKQDNGATHIDRWPLVGASLTPIPCEPRMMPVAAVKSAFKSIGVELGSEVDEPAETAPTGVENIAEHPVDLPLAGKSFGEELDGALAAISGVVTRGEAIKQSREAEGRTIGKESLAKIAELSSALKSLEVVVEPEPAGLTDEQKDEALRLKASLLRARTQPLLGVHTNE